MRKIRFIMHSNHQIGERTYKDFYKTEIVEVSERAYELLTSEGTAHHLTFMDAEKLEEGRME